MVRRTCTVNLEVLMAHNSGKQGPGMMGLFLMACSAFCAIMAIILIFILASGGFSKEGQVNEVDDAENAHDVNTDG